MPGAGVTSQGPGVRWIVWGPALWGRPTGFAFSADGDLYVAENPPSKLVLVTRDGSVRTLATKADGLDNRRQRAAVAPDRRAHAAKDKREPWACSVLA